MKNVNNYYKSYNASDSTRMFLYSLLIPYVAVFLLYAVYIVIANIINMKIEEFEKTLPVLMTNAVFMQICFVVIFFVFNRKRQIDFVIASKLNNKPQAKFVAISICMGFAFLWFSDPTMQLFERGLIELGCNIKSDLGFKLDSAGTIIFAILFLGILPALVEELIFRGVILQGLRKFGDCFAVVMSALLFMLMHGNIQQTIYQFAFGVLAGYVVIKTGSLWISIIMHAINNTFVIAVNSIQTCMGIENTTASIDVLFILRAVLYLIILAFIIYFGVKLINKIKNSDPKLKEVCAIDTKISNPNTDLEPKLSENLYTYEDNRIEVQEGYKAENINIENENIKFKDGFNKFMADKTLKKEGILGFGIALTLMIFNTISMFLN